MKVPYNSNFNILRLESEILLPDDDQSRVQLVIGNRITSPATNNKYFIKIIRKDLTCYFLTVANVFLSFINILTSSG